MGDAAAHLAEAARPLLELSDAERIAWIDRDLWIGYGRAQVAHARLQRILASERRQRPDNLLVVGASNNGKTAIARRFAARNTPPENPEADRANIPVAFVQMPNGSRIPPLLTAVLQALGREPGRRPTTAQLRDEAYGAMRDVGLRLLLLDDLHNIRGSGAAGMLVELRNLGSVTGVSLGAFATKEIASVLRQDEQMANRFELMTLPRWRLEDIEYARLLTTFEQVLPLRRPSGLAAPPLARAILLAADGLIGGIAGAIRHAAVEAIRSGQERINADSVATAPAASASRLDAIARTNDL